LIKLANFTRHDQSEHVNSFKLLGYTIDPAPRAPTANFKKMNEEKLIKEISKRLVEIKNQGFDAILIGGLTSCMIYAWYVSQDLDLKVLTAQFRVAEGFGKRTRKKLKNVREILTAQEVSKWDGQAKEKVPVQSRKSPNSSMESGSRYPARPAANSPGT